MKTFNFLFLLAIALLAMVPSHRAAADSILDGWWPGHWDWAEYKHFNGYLEKGKDTQNTQWAREDWYVQDWLSQYKDQFALIDGFYKADILRDQTNEDGVPVLVVGPMFYRLGGLDKRKVVTTLDTVYGITVDGKHPVIVLKDWYTEREIGLFTKEGLQLE